MKILRIISSANPESGGVIESVIQSSLALKKIGHCLEILTFDSKHSPWMNNPNITINSPGNAYTSYRFSPSLHSWLINNHSKYDHFIIDGVWQYHSICSSIILRMLRRKYYLFTHGMLDDWFKINYPIKHIKKLFYWTFFERHVVKNAHKVFFTTNKEVLSSKKSFPLFVCNESISSLGTEGFMEDVYECSYAFIDRYPELHNKKYLLFLGRIHAVKGLDLLFKGYAENKSINSDYSIVIAGPDQNGLKSSLNKLCHSLGVEDKVIWAGMLEGKIKWGAILSSSAFILPSHHENFGMVIPEALSCGVPVLLTNKVQVHETIEEYGAGFVSEDNEDGIAELIKKWIMLPKSEKVNMKNNAYSCFKNNYEINMIAKKFIDNIITEDEKS